MEVGGQKCKPFSGRHTSAHPQIRRFTHPLVHPQIRKFAHPLHRLIALPLYRFITHPQIRKSAYSFAHPPACHCEGAQRPKQSPDTVRQEPMPSRARPRPSSGPRRGWLRRLTAARYDTGRTRFWCCPRLQRAQPPSRGRGRSLGLRWLDTALEPKRRPGAARQNAPRARRRVEVEGDIGYTPGRNREEAHGHGLVAQTAATTTP